MIDAEVLATECDGNPALVCKKYGKGKIYFLPFPMEQWLADQPNAFACDQGREFFEIYRKIFSPHLHRIVAKKSSPFLEITEHPTASDTCEIVALSYTDTVETFKITLSPAWGLTETVVGKITASGKDLSLTPENGLCRFSVKLTKK